MEDKHFLRVKFWPMYIHELMRLEKSPFGSHYSNGGFRQESSVFDKTRGKITTGDWVLHRLQLCPCRIVNNEWQRGEVIVQSGTHDLQQESRVNTLVTGQTTVTRPLSDVRGEPTSLLWLPARQTQMQDSLQNNWPGFWKLSRPRRTRRAVPC